MHAGEINEAAPEVTDGTPNAPGRLKFGAGSDTVIVG